MRARLLPHATEGQMQLQVQLLQIQARQVPHLDLLQVPPQPFHRVQVRGVRRQRLHVDRVAGLRHELLDLGPPVDRRPVPDHQQPIPGQAAQVDEELDRCAARSATSAAPASTPCPAGSRRP